MKCKDCAFSQLPRMYRQSIGGDVLHCTRYDQFRAADLDRECPLFNPDFSAADGVPNVMCTGRREPQKAMA